MFNRGTVVCDHGGSSKAGCLWAWAAPVQLEMGIPQSPPRPGGREQHFALLGQRGDGVLIRVNLLLREQCSRRSDQDAVDAAAGRGLLPCDGCQAIVSRAVPVEVSQ